MKRFIMPTAYASLASRYEDFILEIPDEIPYIREITRENGLFAVLSPDHAQLMRLYDSIGSAASSKVMLTEALPPSVFERNCRSIEHMPEERGILFLTPSALCSRIFRRAVRMKTFSAVIMTDAHRAVWPDADFTAGYFHVRAWLQTLILRPRLILMSRCFPSEDSADILTDTFSLCRVFRSARALRTEDFLVRTAAVRDEEERTEQLLRAVSGTGGCPLIICRDGEEAQKIGSVLRTVRRTALFYSGMNRRDMSSALLLIRQAGTDCVITDHASISGVLDRRYALLIFTAVPRAPEVIFRACTALSEDAPCLILSGSPDIHSVGSDILASMASDPYALPDPVIQTELENWRLERLGIVSGAVRGDRCLPKVLLDAVGIRQRKRCGQCSACEPVGEMRDVTEDAVLVLKTAGGSHLQLTKERLDAFLSGCVKGDRLRAKYEKEPLYGCLKNRSSAYRNALTALLFRKKYLTAEVRRGDFRIRATKLASTVSPEGQRVFLDSSFCGDTGVADNMILSSPVSQALYDALLQMRRRLSVSDGVPTYEIFSNITLRALALSMPLNEAALSRIPYLHPQSVDRYGKAILACIRGYLEENKT